MIRLYRHFFPLFLLCMLLVACSPIQLPSASQGAKSTATTASQVTATAEVNPADVCPSYLKDYSGCFTPHALREAYGIASLIQQGFTGKGQTIIDIVSFGSPTLQADMDRFCQQFNLPPIQIQILSPIGTVPFDERNNDMTGWAGETELDVQIIHALAPDAKIIVLTSPVSETEGTIGLPQFRQLEQYVLDHHLGNIVSQSWGVSELTLQDQAGQQELQKWNDLYQKATTQLGMTYLTSSGDHGATDVTDLQGKHLASKRATNFPADLPWLTSVGGTTLQRHGSTFTEQAWGSDGSAGDDGGSGGGISQFYSTPNYQQTLGPSVQQLLQGKRGIPDVSAAADPRTGMPFYFHYSADKWVIAGGTSASSPVWAAIMAIANQKAGHPLGFINPALYKLAQSSTYAQDFHDVTVGNNDNPKANVQGYSATSGWDAVTGLGSPNAEKLIPDLIAAMQ